MQGSTDLVQAVARPFVDVDQHHARETEELYRFGHFPVPYGSREGRVFRPRIQLGWVPPKPPSELAAGLRVALSGPLWDGRPRARTVTAGGGKTGGVELAA